jgi:hypothetical protein
MVTLLPLSSAQIKNKRSYTYTPVICLNGMNRHNFTLLTFTVQPRNKAHVTVTQPDFSSCLSALMSCSIQVLRQYTVSPCNTSFT